VSAPATSDAGGLSGYFGLASRGTTVRREVIAGLTTFLAMAYISVVNPAILSEAGMDFGAVFVATCLAAAAGSALMGLIGNLPVALAPGMGQNAFFTYTIVIGSGHSYQTALGAVFVSGVIFLVLSILPVREWLINAIPRNLKLGISAGVGLFLGFIALQNAGVVVDNPATLVSLGDLSKAAPLLALVGFMIIVGMTARRMIGAVIVGMLAASALGWLTGAAEFQGLVSMPPSPGPVLLALDIGAALEYSMLTVILTLLLVDVFDTAGTIIGVGMRAGFIEPDGRVKGLKGALLSDSGATVLGALFGTSSTTSYIESATGVEAGGRTGLTALVVAALFLATLFFAPLAQSVPAYASAAALLFVACLMARGLADLDWEDATEAAPAVVMALAMPLAYSIADGIGIGFIAYIAVKLASGRPGQCPPAVYVVGLIFALKFAFVG